MQHTWRRRLLGVARAVIDERVRRTRRARARRCPCARWTAGSGSSSASTPTASTAPSPASPTARRRRGASRRTADDRSRCSGRARGDPRPRPGPRPPGGSGDVLRRPDEVRRCSSAVRCGGSARERRGSLEEPAAPLAHSGGQWLGAVGGTCAANDAAKRGGNLHTAPTVHAGRSERARTSAGHLLPTEHHDLALGRPDDW